MAKITTTTTQPVKRLFPRRREGNSTAQRVVPKNKLFESSAICKCSAADCAADAIVFPKERIQLM